MALTLWQKIRIGMRRFTDSSADSDRRRREELVARNTAWSTQEPKRASEAARADSNIDREGLQVAYLDDSGQFEHYFDPAGGEVIDRLVGSAEAIGEKWIAIPRRDASSDAADRRMFAESVEKESTRNRLLAAAPEARTFRAALAEDRTLERRWYNFKNDRASEAIERWLRDHDLA